MQDLVGGSAITSGSITNGPVTDTTRLSQTPVLQVEGLTVQVATPLGGKTVLDNLSFSLVPNEVLCLAGESGSGKSMTALAIDDHWRAVDRGYRCTQTGGSRKGEGGCFATVNGCTNDIRRAAPEAVPT